MGALLEKQHLQLLIPESEIKERISAVSAELNVLYEDQELVLVMVMKGAVCFVADLIRNLTMPLNLDFVRCCSYGIAGTKRTELTILGLEHINIKGKHVLIVDDIYDSGNTLAALRRAFLDMEPGSLRTMVLLHKEVPRVITEEPDYSLFRIKNEFVVGYGLDYKEYYRGLPGVYVIHVED